MDSRIDDAPLRERSPAEGTSPMEIGPDPARAFTPVNGSPLQTSRLNEQPLPSAPPLPVESGGPSGIRTVTSRPFLYHERQEMLLCGMHALNALLQGPFFDEVQLATLAQGLDIREREVMAEAGMETAEYLRFLAEDSSNVANDGNFSIQVLTAALELYGLGCMNLESREAWDAKEQPHLEQAFICHLRAHWFAIRRVNGQWFDFNSLHAAPRELSDFYLSAYLLTLKEEGWTVLVVRGRFPDPGMLAADTGSHPQGRWYTPESAKEALKEAEAEAKRAEAAAAALQFESLPGNSVWGSGGGSQTQSGWAPTVINQGRKLMQGAITTAWAAPGTGRVLVSGDAAVAGTAAGTSGGSSSAASQDADADLEKAIAASLQMHFDLELQRRLAHQTAGAGPQEPSQQQPQPPSNTLVHEQGLQGSQEVQGTGAPEQTTGDTPEAHGTESRGSESTSSGGGKARGSGGGPSDPGSGVQCSSGTAGGDDAVHPAESADQQLAACPTSQSGPLLAKTSPAVPAQALPSEEGGGSVASVELAIQLPGGARLQRRFRREDCVEAVVQFVRTHLDKNVRFVLAERGHGGKALVNLEMTLGAAGVQDRTMLVVKCQSPFS